MTFKIHQVYNQKKTQKVNVDTKQTEAGKEEEKVSSPQNLSLSSSSQPKNLQQLRNDVLNSRSSVKPGSKNAVRPTAFDGGLEGDMY